mgnify:CR=1 FL=1
MGLSMTKKDLATVAGYTYRQLHNIDIGLPDDRKLFVKGEGDKYDLAIFVQRWVDYNVQREAPDGIEDLDLVKAKHEVVKIQKTELEVAKMRGVLIDVQDVRRLWGDVANTVMQNFIHLPSKVAPLMRMMDNTEAIAGIMEDEIRKILEGIAETPLPDYAAEEEEELESEDGEA